MNAIVADYGSDSVAVAVALRCQGSEPRGSHPCLPRGAHTQPGGGAAGCGSGAQNRPSQVSFRLYYTIQDVSELFLDVFFQELFEGLKQIKICILFTMFKSPSLSVQPPFVFYKLFVIVKTVEPIGFKWGSPIY